MGDKTQGACRNYTFTNFSLVIVVPFIIFHDTLVIVGIHGNRIG